MMLSVILKSSEQAKHHVRCEIIINSGRQLMSQKIVKIVLSVLFLSFMVTKKDSANVETSN